MPRDKRRRLGGWICYYLGLSMMRVLIQEISVLLEAGVTMEEIASLHGVVNQQRVMFVEESIAKVLTRLGHHEWASKAPEPRQLAEGIAESIKVIQDGSRDTPEG